MFVEDALMKSIYEEEGKTWLCTLCMYKSRFKNNVRQHVRIHKNYLGWAHKPRLLLGSSAVLFAYDLDS